MENTTPANIAADPSARTPPRPASAGRPRRWFWVGVVAILAGAGLWRSVTAATLPAISRDGVTFCWYARDLGTQGLAFLQSPTAQQHPLFPAAILAVQRVSHALGIAETPMTWQRCGQLVCWLAGMTVIILTGVLTIRLVRLLKIPLDEHIAALAAMLMAALLDLNIWLSSDVMSGQLHLAFYLAATILLLNFQTPRAALCCGLLGGLAFLTRQEGAVPVIAGLAVLVMQRRHLRARRLLICAAALIFGFVLCTAPYWSTVGRLSTKKDMFGWLRGDDRPASTRSAEQGVDATNRTRPLSRDGNVALAKLEVSPPPVYALLPHILYRLFRAGRVVIPLLAIFPLVTLRRRLLKPPLLGLITCMAGHLTLTAALLSSHGYLQPRHMLVVIMLLVPLAAITLSHVAGWFTERRRALLGTIFITACLVPLAVYALRTPNFKDRYVVQAAQWLVQHDPGVAGKRLLCGTSPMRIAFYADMRWEPWFEEPEQYGVLRQQIREGPAGYLAIDVGPGFEREGNRELVEQLEEDPALAGLIREVHVQPGPDKNALHVFEVGTGR